MIGAKDLRTVYNGFLFVPDDISEVVCVFLAKYEEKECKNFNLCFVKNKEQFL